MLSGQTNEAIWWRDTTGFKDVEVWAGVPIVIGINQRGPIDCPTLDVHITSEARLKEDVTGYATKYVISLFRLGDDLGLFYREFSSDPIAVSFATLRGLRPMKATNLFESLICSICSQNTSVERWNSMVRFLKRRWGCKFKVGCGEFYSFPEPHVLAKAEKGELIIGGLGYRADYIREASLAVESSRIDLEALRGVDYSKAYHRLLGLRGVGPKVANCFCLYGLGFTMAAPVDRWVERAVAELYFNGCTPGRSVVCEFIRRRFGDWAGYAQLYLFHHWRSKRGMNYADCGSSFSS
ncbi:MAG: hypothetical protein QXJ75_00620 [Candidatus Bathyarchaeia archaeon]